MSPGRIAILVAKDLRLFFKNPFIAVIVLLGVFTLTGLYFLLPRTVDETLEIGVYAPAMPFLPGQAEGEGFSLQAFDSEEALKEAVTEGDTMAGVAVSPGALADHMRGGQLRITLYIPSDIPEELRDSVEVLLQTALAEGGDPALEIEEEVLGRDMLGEQIAPRSRMRPLLAIVIVMFEIFGLANLISEEIEHRTLQAVLTTPVTTAEVVTSKAITGVFIAFSQALFFSAVAGALAVKPLIILVTLLLGALLAAGVGFLVASIARDFMTVIVVSMIIMIILIVPGFTVIFPGAFTGWIKAVPAHYLVDTVHRVTNFGAGWSEVWRNILILVGFDAVIFGAGILVLRRKTL